MGDFTHTSDSVESASTREQTGFTAIMTLPDGRRLRLSGYSLDCAVGKSNGFVLTAQGRAGILSFNSWEHSQNLLLWPDKRFSEAIIDVNLSTLCDALPDHRENESDTGISYSIESCEERRLYRK